MKDTVRTWEDDKKTSYRLVLTNEQTGEVQFDLPDCRGGIVIAQRGDNSIETSQGMFGSVPALAICITKLPGEIARMVEKAPPKVAEMVETILKMTGL